MRYLNLCVGYMCDILLATKVLSHFLKMRIYFGTRYLLNPLVYSNVSYIFGISTSRRKKMSTFRGMYDLQFKNSSDLKNRKKL